MLYSVQCECTKRVVVSRKFKSSVENLQIPLEVHRSIRTISNERILKARGWLAVAWIQGGHRQCRKVTKRNVTGRQPARWRHGLCLNLRVCTDVEARFRVCVRSETDAMRAPGRRTVFLPHNTPLSLPLSRPAPFSVTSRFYFPPRSSCFPSEIKGHRFSHSKKRERFRSSRPDNAEYIR